MSPHAEVSIQTSADMAVNAEQTFFVNGNPKLHSPSSPRSRLQRSDGGPYHLICVGFGPASLAIAIALNDAVDAPKPLPGLAELHHRVPKVLFVERQEGFAWHQGMLLPGSKMQINFIKDLATMRNPRSEFTFLNYLHKHGRLAQFVNLDTFLPQRIEYEDYMRWCADSFKEVVEYGCEVVKIFPMLGNKGDKIHGFCIEMKEIASGNVKTSIAKNVVIAVGGRPCIPSPFPANHRRVIHSSSYAKSISSVLDDKSKMYSIAVIGSGQSAAEIFHDLHSRYPNSRTRLLIRGAALKPSDDSAFVNEIFDSTQVDIFYRKSAHEREVAIFENRGTNYGVVSGGLLQQIYDDLYMQRIRQPHEVDWQHRILKRRYVTKAEASPYSVRLHIRNYEDESEEMLDADLLIVAAGYTRDIHETLLEPVRYLTENGTKFNVGRNYKIELSKDKIATGAGIWLQGCNESTHGLSDSLLSILATRGGDMVDSIFGHEELGG